MKSLYSVLKKEAKKPSVIFDAGLLKFICDLTKCTEQDLIGWSRGQLGRFYYYEKAKLPTGNDSYSPDFTLIEKDNLFEIGILNNQRMSDGGVLSVYTNIFKFKLPQEHHQELKTAIQDYHKRKIENSKIASMCLSLSFLEDSGDNKIY